MQRPLPRLMCRARVVTGARVAVESVAGVIPIDFHFGMRGVDLLDFLGGNMRILLAEMEHDRRRRRFTGIVPNAASVVAYRRSGMKPAGGHPGQGSAEAVEIGSAVLSEIGHI